MLSSLIVKLDGQENFYRNPILSGFYPDPSICRVNDDYYLVNSSFAYFPGVPIFQSKDLVNWKQIGHVLNRPSQLNLDGLGVSRGIFAPAIQYYNGTFYLITTLVDNGDNFIVTAKNPGGPWSDPIWLPEVKGIDPSMFFDEDGKVYIIHNDDAPDNKPLYQGHRAIWIWDFDLENLQVKGEKKLLINGGAKFENKPIWIEGPHIFKVNNYYYLIAAEGGTEFNHSEVVFRSGNVYGPYISYKNNPILTQRHLNSSRPYPVTNTGHADFVETQNGEWWAVFLGCRPYKENFFNTGRETFMAKVEWEDNWPIIKNGLEPISYKCQTPLLEKSPVDDFPKNGNFEIVEEFDKSELGYEWLFLRTPRKKWYELKNSQLILNLQPETITRLENPAFIARRLQHTNCSVVVTLDFTPKNEKEIAGITAFQNEKFFYYLGKTLQNGKEILGVYISDTKEEGNGDMKLLASSVLSDLELNKPIFLKITIDGDNCSFSFSYNNLDWFDIHKNADATILSTEVAGGFVGTMLAMYATSNGFMSGNSAKFNCFKYTGNDTVFTISE
jgi:alpha-N-arabinofuranosidase